MRAKQVTFGGHHRDGRVGPHQLEPGRQVRHDKHPGQELLDRGGELSRRHDKFNSGHNGPQALIAHVLAGPATRSGGPVGPANPPKPLGSP